MIIRRIEPLSLARIVAAVYAAFGLLIGGIVSHIAMMGGGGAGTTGMARTGDKFGPGAVIILPIV